ncbi:MAG: DUF1015 domain-containing protein [Chloroflexota bacterium]|nr:DUF1015 domain-containing protein [Chloroflexota bacterium]MDE2895749.1 DUF1015 domain-containing protein [Chloroflexota bacterium]
MVNVQPFRGLRYDPDVVGDWGAVLGPPYDIVDAAQTAALKASSPYQIAHIETAAGDDIAAAAQILRDWRSIGAIVRDDAPSYYLHEHHFADGPDRQVRRAIFGAVELRPWGDGVMAHERTMPGPRATRTALRSVVGADVSPLMAFAPDADGALAEMIDIAFQLPLLYEGADPAGDVHTLRRIDGANTVMRISDAFAHDTIYMADGHHRYESALASIDDRPASRRVLMGVACAGDPALVVGATHRVVHADVPASLVAQLGRSFSVSESDSADIAARLPDGSSSIGLVTNGGAWLLEPTDAAARAMPDDVPDAWRNLAPAVLQHVILEPLLGIDADALAGGRAVSYTHHLDELLQAISSGTANAAFVLPAPTLQDVIDTADAGSFMPQKSTYFVPKLPTGLVLHALD